MYTYNFFFTYSEIYEGKMIKPLSLRRCKLILSKTPKVHHKMSRDSLRDNGLFLYYANNLLNGQWGL